MTCKFHEGPTYPLISSRTFSSKLGFLMVGNVTFCKVTSEETVNGLYPLYIAIWIWKVMINHCGDSTCAIRLSLVFRPPPVGPRWFHDAGPSGHLLAADLSTTAGLYDHNRATDPVPLHVASPADAQCDTWSWVDGSFPKMDLVHVLTFCSGCFVEHQQSRFVSTLIDRR